MWRRKVIILLYTIVKLIGVCFVVLQGLVNILIRMLTSYIIMLTSYEYNVN
jgi:hypothetical protein